MVEHSKHKRKHLVGRVWVDAEHLGGQRAYIRVEDADTVRTVWTTLNGRVRRTQRPDRSTAGAVQSATLHALPLSSCQPPSGARAALERPESSDLRRPSTVVL